MLTHDDYIFFVREINRSKNVPVIEVVVNGDEYYERMAKLYRVVELSTVPPTTKMRELVSVSYTDSDSDRIYIPKCACPENIALKGAHLVGRICPKCNEPVKDAPSIPDGTRLWFKQLEGMSLNPNMKMLSKLMDRFTVFRTNIIEYLIDTSIDKPANAKAAMLYETVESLGIKRGLTYFTQNYLEIYEKLNGCKKFKKKGSEIFHELFMAYHESFLSVHLPLPDKHLIVLEEFSMCSYLDFSTDSATQAIIVLRNLTTQRPEKRDENRLSKAYMLLIKYYDAQIKDRLGGPEGLYRKHIFASRSNFTMYAVISSVERFSDPEQIFIPWNIGIAIFRLHLVNLMNRSIIERGEKPWTHNQIIKYLYYKHDVYCPWLAGLMDSLIKGGYSPKGFPGVGVRFPTMLFGSRNRFFIGGVKSNVSDYTISVHSLVLPAVSGDHDGDHIACAIKIDRVQLEQEKFNIYRNAFVLDTPGKISRNVEVAMPALETISRWLDEDE